MGEPEFRSLNEKSRVPDTFQLGAISAFSDFLNVSIFQ